MPRYIALYMAPRTVAERFADASPEEARAGVQAWIDWQHQFGPRIVDAGRPFGRAVTVTPAGVEESRSEVVGMSVLDAPSLDQALEVVEGHHHLRWAEGCRIELFEQSEIPELAGAAADRERVASEP